MSRGSPRASGPLRGPLCSGHMSHSCVSGRERNHRNGRQSQFQNQSLSPAKAPGGIPHKHTHARVQDVSQLFTDLTPTCSQLHEGEGGRKMGEKEKENKKEREEREQERLCSKHTCRDTYLLVFTCSYTACVCNDGDISVYSCTHMCVWRDHVQVPLSHGWELLVAIGTLRCREWGGQ